MLNFFFNYEGAIPHGVDILIPQKFVESLPQLPLIGFIERGVEIFASFQLINLPLLRTQ